MMGHLSNGLRLAAFFSITIVALATGCHHQRPTPGGAPAASNQVSQVSPALIGKQITIRGKFSLRGKIAPALVVLENHQIVYLNGSWEWAATYTEMEGKLVEATGILRFYRDNEPADPPGAPQRARLPDYFYFEAETARLRAISR